MPSVQACPEEAELLAVAAGEVPSETLKAHLADCSRCRERLGQIRSELALLRDRPSPAPLAPSTAMQPRSQPATANGCGDEARRRSPARKRDPRPPPYRA
jgi:hypothetical protein